MNLIDKYFPKHQYTFDTRPSIDGPLEPKSEPIIITISTLSPDMSLCTAQKRAWKIADTSFQVLTNPNSPIIIRLPR